MSSLDLNFFGLFEHKSMEFCFHKLIIWSNIVFSLHLNSLYLIWSQVFVKILLILLIKFVKVFLQPSINFLWDFQLLTLWLYMALFLAILWLEKHEISLNFKNFLWAWIFDIEIVFIGDLIFIFVFEFIDVNNIMINVDVFGSLKLELVLF